MGGGGGYSSPVLCVPQLASSSFCQLPALRCKTRQNECHISFLRKLSKSEKIIPGVVLVKLSAEQRNKWRKSPPFTTIFPYQYNRDSCREFEERQKNHGSASKILCNFFSKGFSYLDDIDFEGQAFQGYLDLQCIFDHVVSISTWIPHIPYNTNIVFKPFITCHHDQSWWSPTRNQAMYLRCCTPIINNA